MGASFPHWVSVHNAYVIEDEVVPHRNGQTCVGPCEVSGALRGTSSMFSLQVGRLAVFEHFPAGTRTASWSFAFHFDRKGFARFPEPGNFSAQSNETSINGEDPERLSPQHAALGQGLPNQKVGPAERGSHEIVERAAEYCPQGAGIIVDSHQGWMLGQARSCQASINDLSPFSAEDPLTTNVPKPDREDPANAPRISLVGEAGIHGIGESPSMTSPGLDAVHPDVSGSGGLTDVPDLAGALPESVPLWANFMETANGQVAALSVSAAIGTEYSCEVDVNHGVWRMEPCNDAIMIRGGLVNSPEMTGPERFRDIF